MATITGLRLLASRRQLHAPSPAEPVATAAAPEDELPIPSDIKTVFLGGLFVMGVLAACYFAAEIVLPIVLAFVLNLVLQPAMRVLDRAHIRHGLAALLIILVLFGTCRVGDGALGPSGELGAAAARRDSQAAGTPKLSEPTTGSR